MVRRVGVARTQNGHFWGHEVVARLAAQILGGASLCAIELVEQVGVGAERHRRRVTRLARDLDDRGSLRDQQANEAVAQVVRPCVLDTGGGRRFSEPMFAPVPGAVGVPGRTVRRGEDEIRWCVTRRSVPPRSQVLGE